MMTKRDMATVLEPRTPSPKNWWTLWTRRQRVGTSLGSVASDGFTVAGETAFVRAVAVATDERSRESSSADRTEKVMADGLGGSSETAPSSVFRMPASSFFGAVPF